MSNLNIKRLKLINLARIRLLKGNNSHQNQYEINTINDIVYNEKSHSVAKFKDFLIYDDISEFLKRYYLKEESTKRLPKVFEFYESYSKIFPNYTNIPESKYMYKNIKRKQKVIDNMQPDDDDAKSIAASKAINTEAYNSIMNQTESILEHIIDESAQSFEKLVTKIHVAENNVKNLCQLTKCHKNSSSKELKNSISYNPVNTDKKTIENSKNLIGKNNIKVKIISNVNNSTNISPIASPFLSSKGNLKIEENSKKNEPPKFKLNLNNLIPQTSITNTQISSDNKKINNLIVNSKLKTEKIVNNNSNKEYNKQSKDKYPANNFSNFNKKSVSPLVKRPSIKENLVRDNNSVNTFQYSSTTPIKQNDLNTINYDESKAEKYKNVYGKSKNYDFIINEMVKPLTERSKVGSNQVSREKKKKNN